MWFSLATVSISKIPLMGLGLPAISTEMTELMKRAGMHTGPKFNWTDVPTISFRLDDFFAVEDPSLFLYLDETEVPDAEKTERVVAVMLDAERKLISEAGDLRLAVEWLKALPAVLQTSGPWVIPIGYRRLGQPAEAKAFADFCSEKFTSDGQHQWVELYQRFISELNAT